MSELFILDCSITMGWFFKEEQCDYSWKILDSLERASAVVPFLWNMEVTNTIINGEKRKRTDANKAFEFMEFLDTLNITALPFFPPRQDLLRTARAYSLTSYDATYLMLAMHERIPLATKDKALIKACETAGVEVLR
jgi:predicted nucleic acid-binding protein